MELFCEKCLKVKFGSMKLIEFCWILIKDKFPILSDKAQWILISISTSHSRETGFSMFAINKRKGAGSGKMCDDFRGPYIPFFIKLLLTVKIIIIVNSRFNSDRPASNYWSFY